MDPATGTIRATPFLDSLPGVPSSALTLPGGITYARGDSFVFRVSSDGGRAAVGGWMPPELEDRDWRIIAPYEGGRVIASNDVQNADTNIAILEGRSFVRSLRLAGAGNRVTQVWGLAYLE